MSVLQIVNGLKASLTSGQDPFVTYGEFARRNGLSEKYPPAWANRTNLDEAARLLKTDPQIGLDLTFLIRNGTTKYPSVIDGMPRPARDDPIEKSCVDGSAPRAAGETSLQVG